MPLSPPAERQHIHTREITCRGYRRTDGLWDIEGHLTDVKTYAFDMEHRGRLEPGDPVHDLWLRLTVDNHLQVHAIETVTDKGPFTACGEIAPNYQRLVGLNIGKGWTRAVKERLGGVEGCTHLVELLGPVATTAFQTIFPILYREKAERAKAEGREEDKKARPVLLNMCHIFASDGDVVRKFWPEHYTGDCEPTTAEAEAVSDAEAAD